VNGFRLDRVLLSRYDSRRAPAIRPVSSAEARSSATSLRVARWRGLIALIGGTVVLVGISQTSVGHVLLVKAGLLQEPAGGHTSLSFLHPQSLPERLTSERADVRASFVINNATGTTSDYHWSVVLISQGRTRRVHAGKVRLSSGHEAEITQSVAITCARERIRIVVSLEHPAESIGAWMACWSPGS
jgi:hypothetical protein